jgi:hypothetical protein
MNLYNRLMPLAPLVIDAILNKALPDKLTRCLTGMDSAKYLGNVMIDIETLSDQPNAAILCIAAVEFDVVTGETGREFEVHIDLESSFKAGLEVKGTSFYWWLGQNAEARNKIIEAEKVELKDALAYLGYFITRCIEDDSKLDKLIVWGNSARFDLGILHNAFRKFNYPLPWNNFNERCVRTMNALAPEIRKSEPRTGTSHSAKDDCEFQISYLNKIWNKVVNKI